MNKSDLIAQVSKAVGVSEADTGKVVNGLTAAIQEALVKGEKVQMVGFGTFETATRAARKGRNPRTGEEIDIKESRAAKFYAGGPLRDALNPPTE